MEQLFTWEKIIPPNWDLTCVQVRSHLGGTNPFSCKRFVYTEWLLAFCQDLTQVRRLTWVWWFFSYKQLLTVVGILISVTNNNNQKLCIFKSKIKTRCKIFLFLFLIFRLSPSSSHSQIIKLLKLLFTKYKWWRFIYNWLCLLFYESLSQ